MQEDRNVASQLFLGALPLARGARRLGEFAHRSGGGRQHFAIEPELVAEVVVHGRDVGVRRPADLPHGHALEPALGEQALGRFHQTIARFAIRVHSVRLKSSVAAVMATTEKTRRKPRSYAIASNPVFLSSRFLNAWTLYVNGSTTAITCIQAGNPCCG